MSWFRKTPASEPLAVTMAGVTLGNRVVSIGTRDIPLVAALATKAGLTGHAAAIERDPAHVAAATAAFEREGALVEVTAAPFDALPFPAGSFDVAVLADVLPELGEPAARQDMLREVLRILREGGRAVVVEHGPRVRFGRARPLDRSAIEALKAAGFAAARVLAEEDGTLFAEAVKKAGP